MLIFGNHLIQSESNHFLRLLEMNREKNFHENVEKEKQSNQISSFVLLGVHVRQNTSFITFNL